VFKRLSCATIHIMLFIALTCVLFSTVNRAGAETLEIALPKLANDTKIHLRCISGIYDISIPIPERWKVTGARLKFGYINSTNLLEDSSQLVVKFNGNPVAQARLNPKDPEGKMNISIPAGLFEEGYNTLNFTANQHYTRDCETPCAPDLWTTVSLEEATLTIEYSLKPFPLQLSKAPGFLFDPKTLPNGEVNIITDGYTSDILTLAGIAASGVAKRFDYRKVLFSASPEIRRGYDNILIGDKKFVEEFLAKRGVEGVEIKGPLIKIIPLPPDEALINNMPRQPGEILNDANHALLIVSGLDQNHMQIAVETLANLTFPYPGTSEMTPLEFQLPEIALYGGKRMLLSDRAIRLKSLDFITHTFKGMQPTPVDIMFRLPPDFFIKENQYVRFILNYTYGAGLRPDSVLNVTLNGIHVRSINMNKADGDFIEGYKLEIPTYLFKPGTNYVKLVPIMTPHGGECEMIQPESLFLTVFENSSVYFPPMSHFVQMPNLELFTINGFPITRWPDGFESLFYLTSPKKELVDAALNVIGLITQKNGYPLLGLKMSLEEPKGWDGEILLIGETGSIPNAMQKNAPLSLALDSNIAYPVLRDWGDKTVWATSKQRSGLGSNIGLFMENQSPYKPGRTIVTMAAVTAGDVLALSLALMEPVVQSSIKGDLALIQLTPPDYKVDTESVGEKYAVGKYGKFEWKDFAISFVKEYYNYFLAGIFAVLSVAAFFGLKRHERRRIEGDRRDAASGGVAEDKRDAQRRTGMSLWRRALSFLSRLIFKGKPSNKIEVAPAVKKPEVPASDNKNIVAPEPPKDITSDHAERDQQKPGEISDTPDTSEVPTSGLASDDKDIFDKEPPNDITSDPVKHFQQKANDFFAGSPERIRIGVDLNQLVDTLTKIEGFNSLTLGKHLDKSDNPFEALVKTVNELAITEKSKRVKDIQKLLDKINRKSKVDPPKEA